MEFVYNLSEQTESGQVNPYKGSAKLNLLGYIQRNEVLKKLNFTIDGEGKVVFQDEYETNKILSEIARENTLSLDITNEQGKHFSSFDELDFDANVGLLYTELGLKLVQGIQLGNG